MIDRRRFSTTACGYVDKSEKVIHNLVRQTTSPSEVPSAARYLDTRVTSSGEVHQQVKHLGRRGTSADDTPRRSGMPNSLPHRPRAGSLQRKGSYVWSYVPPAEL